MGTVVRAGYWARDQAAGWGSNGELRGSGGRGWATAWVRDCVEGKGGRVTGMGAKWWGSKCGHQAACSFHAPFPAPLPLAFGDKFKTTFQELDSIKVKFKHI